MTHQFNQFQLCFFKVMTCKANLVIVKNLGQQLNCCSQVRLGGNFFFYSAPPEHSVLAFVTSVPPQPQNFALQHFITVFQQRVKPHAS